MTLKSLLAVTAATMITAASPVFADGHQQTGSMDAAADAPIAEAEAEVMAPTAQLFDLATLTCWDVTTLAEDESSFVIAMLIGHNMGVAGVTKTSPKDIVGKIESFDKACVDNPDSPAFELLR
ncbi:MAG: hypothetical protein Alpg2KO_00320 [Alphaproteobacteria bacterium]